MATMTTLASSGDVGKDKTALQNATTSGDMEKVKTAFHTAASSGDIEKVKNLVKKFGVSNTIDCTDSFGQAPIHVAALNGHVELVLLFLNQFGCDPNIKGWNGRSLLHYACQGGRVDLVRSLICEHNADANATDDDQVLPIHVAAMNGHVEVVFLFVNEFGSDLKIKGWNGRSLLHYACQGGTVDLVRTLIREHNADKNATDKDNVLPIHVAAWKGHEEVVSCLIKEFSCDTTQSRVIGRSLLHHACQGGNADLVRTLVCKYNADINAVDLEKDPPIHVAAGKGHTDVVLCLIKEFGCDPTVKGHKGSSLLHRACYGGNVSLVRTLICDFKISIEVVDLENEAPIHVAAWSGHVDIVLALINEFGCDPKMKGRNNRSLLHEACQSGNISLVRTLAEKHLYADKNAKDFKNRTPLYIAVASNHLDIALCLIKEFDCCCDLTDIYGRVSPAQPLVKLLSSVNLTNSNIKSKQENEVLCFINKIWDDDGIARAKLGRFLLHNACKYNNVELVKTLILEQPISPLLLADAEGNTALHISSFHNHPECVKALLDADAPVMLRNNKGLTPLEEATGDAKQILEQHMQDSFEHQKKYDIYFQHARQKYSGKYSITRVFVLGEIEAGKSSLVESMKRSFADSAERVSEASVPPHTAGIIPSIYMDQQYGRLCFYDFAGNAEYYSSHAAILERLSSLSFGHDLFIIVVDLRKDELKIERTLYYWVSFIQHQKFKGIRLSLVIIGSHVDLVDNADVTKKQNHLESLCDKFKSALATQQAFCFMLDCCDPFAYQFHNFKGQILAWKMLSPAYPLNSDLQLLIGLLEKDFSKKMAYSLQTIQDHIRANGFKCLPSETWRFLPIINALHVAGYLLLLSFSNGNNYVVLNCSKLTNEVHRLLFSQNRILSRCDQMLTPDFNVGIIPDTVIKSILPPEITEECLVQLQFCQRISCKDVDAFPCLAASASSRQNFLFFPALCKAEKPSVYGSDLNYSIGLLAYCKDYDYFPPRFLHVLLLELVLRFTLLYPTEAYSSSSTQEHHHFQRRCEMWKTGVHWLMTNGVACTVELVDGNKGIVVISRSSDNRSDNCISVWGKVVECLIKMKSKFCDSVELSCFLLNSVSGDDYLCPDNLFAASEVKKSLKSSENIDSVLSLSGKESIELERFLCICKLPYWQRLLSIGLVTDTKSTEYSDQSEVNQRELDQPSFQSTQETIVKSEDVNLLVNSLTNHAYKWREIGGSLGFQYGELKNIYHNPQNLTLPLQLTELLAQWSQWPTACHQVLPTMEKLCEALRSNLVGLGALANELYNLRNKLPSQKRKSTTSTQS